jgi:hypothetical protein
MLDQGSSWNMSHASFSTSSQAHLEQLTSNPSVLILDPCPVVPKLVTNEEGVLHSSRSVNHIRFKKYKGFNKKQDLRHPFNKIAPETSVGCLIYIQFLGWASLPGGNDGISGGRKNRLTRARDGRPATYSIFRMRPTWVRRVTSLPTCKMVV